MLPEKKEIESLMSERKSLDSALSKYSSEDFPTLLSLSDDLADIIADFGELFAKKDKVAHAAFATKIKFSRKVRRKGKDVGKFEKALVSEFDAKKISLEHGRRMADIIKIMRKGDMEKAAHAAEEYYSILELGHKMEDNEFAIEQVQWQLQKEKGRLQNLLSCIESLAQEPQLDVEKIGRHKKRQQLAQELQNARLGQISKIKSLPLPHLLKMAQEENLQQFGFPEISRADLDALASSLQKLGLSSKAALALAQMCDWNESRLRHEMAEPAAFRHQIVPHRAWLEQIAALENSHFLRVDGKHGAFPANSSAHSGQEGGKIDSASAYLSAHSPQASDAYAQISAHDKTASDDDAEFARHLRIEREKAELGGITKEKILANLKEAEDLEAIISGNAKNDRAGGASKGGGTDSHATASGKNGGDEGGHSKAAGNDGGGAGGIVGTILSFFGRKN